MRTKYSFSIFILLFFIGTASAATYYLDAVNGNDANPGTSSQPWKTLARAMTSWSGAGVKVTNGDTVKLRTGNYGAFSEMNIAHTDWITYEADTGHLPVLTGIGINHYTSPKSHQNVYLRFRNIVVDVANFGDGGMFIKESNNVEVINCTFIGHGYLYEEGGSAYNRGINMWDAANVLIDSCTIYGDGDGNGISAMTSVGGQPGTLFGKGFQVGIASPLGWGSQGIEIKDCNIWSCEYGIWISNVAENGWALSNSGWNVHNNEIHHLTDDGIDVIQNNPASSGLTDPIVIAYNHIHHVADFNELYGYKVHNDLIQFQNNENSHIVIRGNKCHDSDVQGFFFRSFSAITSTDWLIENNLIYNCNLEPGAYNYAVRIYSAKEIVFRNNTIIGHDLPSGMMTGENESGEARFTAFTGNIIHTIDIQTDDGVVIDYENYNIVKDKWVHMTSHTWGPNTIVVANENAYNALFNDYNANDFRLSASSPAIDLGVPDYSPSTDLLGNPRDSQPDAGCYEFQGAGQQCAGTDVSCGVWPNCTNCDLNDGCFGTAYRNYSCSGTSCTYIETANDPKCTTECIDNTKLLDYIFQWKQGSITMPTLMQKIGAWKAGIGC